EAKNEGAMALFGEKYGDVVRTIRVSDFSFELCGGTHIDNTGEAKCFKIISESGVAAGVRRIEAITGNALLKYYNNKLDTLNAITLALKSNDTDILNKLNNVLNENKMLKQEVENTKKIISSNDTKDIKTETINGLNVVIEKFDGKGNSELKDIVDSIKDKLENYVVVAISKNDGNASIVVSISDAAISKGLHAGNMLKEIAKTLSGNGGGRDKFAEGKGKDASKIDEAIELARKIING
ncbi:MAG: alanine--tRNA ligase, partial [Lachnospiraceae bacterium]|nr:alanine--tRNA ligase [Lachnospiraceae bacterium]